MKTGKPFSDRTWSGFILNISAVVVLFSLGVFIGLIIRSNQLIQTEILRRAQAHFADIVITRRWNAEYGGVFVEKTEGVISNPYLENPDRKEQVIQEYLERLPLGFSAADVEAALDSFHGAGSKPGLIGHVEVYLAPAAHDWGDATVEDARKNSILDRKTRFEILARTDPARAKKVLLQVLDTGSSGSVRH